MDSHGVDRLTSKTPKNVTNKDFLSIFYRNPINQYKRPRGESVRL